MERPATPPVGLYMGIDRENKRWPFVDIAASRWHAGAA
jgi:hypothetical protein